MEEYLETTYDKFIFRARTGCLYSADEVWVRLEGESVVIGVTDYEQKSKGDVTYLETLGAGTAVTRGQEIGRVETIKATFDIISPVAGRIVEVNPELENNPYIINEDPFGAGWIYRIEASALGEDQKALMPAEKYFEVMREKVAREAKTLYG